MGQLRSTFGSNLEAARKGAGYSRERLAEICATRLNMEIDPQSIRNYEKGDRWPDPEVVEVLAAALQRAPSALYAKPNEIPPPTPMEIVRTVAERFGVEIPGIERARLAVMDPAAAVDRRLEQIAKTPSGDEGIVLAWLRGMDENQRRTLIDRARVATKRAALSDKNQA